MEDIGLVGDSVVCWIGYISSPCTRHIRLTQELDELVRSSNKSRGKYSTKAGDEVTTPNQIADANNINIWHQGWMSEKDIGLVGDSVVCWINYISSLQIGHIRLTKELDELVYTKIRKARAPKKTKVFMLLTLMNRVPNLDLLQKKNNNRLCRCFLCKAKV